MTLPVKERIIEAGSPRGHIQLMRAVAQAIQIIAGQMGFTGNI